MSVGTDIPGSSSSQRRRIVPAERESSTRSFPWMLAISPNERTACERDLAEAGRTDQPHLVATELTSWKETAAAVAAGLGNVDLEWLDEDEAVERP